MVLSDSIELIAHRGASADAPENTLRAFELAWQQGADAIECDIRVSRDNRIMVHHDATTKRMTGTDYIISQRHSRTLRSLDSAHFSSTVSTHQRIPYLHEVLETVPDGKRIFIEIKCGREILPVLEKQLPESMWRQIVLIGFESDVMASAKQMFPKIPTFWLFQRSLLSRVRNSEKDFHKAIAHAKRLGLDGLDIRSRDCTKSFAAEIVHAGLDICAWTVNDPEEASRLISWGVSKVTTDRPAWLRDQLHISK